MQAHALIDFADLAHENGQTAIAEERAREGLRLSHRLVDRQLIVYSLALLARFAAADGNKARAGRLWGAVEAEEARRPIGTWERHQRGQFAEAVLTNPSVEFDAARSAGRRLSLDQAVEDALAAA
jgi:hypothetical protein